MIETLDSKTIQYFRRKCLAWFDLYGRHTLPWQMNKTPYKVWLSEVMLQQTQVNTVIPYFNNFIEEFPTVLELAQADLDQVLSLWAGLGYYRRAKYLHGCAQTVIAEFNGEFPTDLKSLMSLPGIGRSTAGAIMSLSMNEKAAILDGNVKRVLSRFLAIEKPLTESSGMKDLWAVAEQLTPNKRFDAYNQALMDLGATCCTRHKPSCDDCPLVKKCKAYAQGDPIKYPVRPLKIKAKPKRQTQMLILVNRHNHVLLEKRSHNGIWPGLYSLPEAGFSEEPVHICNQSWSFKAHTTRELDQFTHQFTHFNLHIKPVVCHVEHQTSACLTLNDAISDQYSWHAISDALKLGIPAPVKKLLKPLLQSKILLKG
jgi:A/G-specific adenine glycosylase